MIGRCALPLAAVLLAGCHLAIDDDRHLGSGDSDAGHGPRDAGTADGSADAGSDAGADAGGTPCSRPGVEPVCGPPDFATCGEDLRCRPCWGEETYHDIYYEAGGVRPPQGVPPALALVRDDGGEPHALLLWAVDRARDGSAVPVVTAIPLNAGGATPVSEHLTLTSGPFASLATARAVALGAVEPGPDAAEALMLVAGADSMGARVLASARLAVSGGLPVISDPQTLPVTHELVDAVAVNGSSAPGTTHPLLYAWGELTPSDGMTLSSLTAAGEVSTTVAAVELAGGGPLLRGTAGRLLLAQPEPGGDVYLWDATSGNPPVTRSGSTGRADLAHEGGDDYVLAYPEDDRVQLVRIACLDPSSCSSLADGSLGFEAPVSQVAVAPVQGGVVLAAIVDKPFEHILTVAVLDEGLRPIEGVHSEGWIHDSAAGTYLGLELAAVRSAEETRLVVSALRRDLGGGEEEHAHVIRSLRLPRECPAVP